jgi:hypothetical protein
MRPRAGAIEGLVHVEGQGNEAPTPPRAQAAAGRGGAKAGADPARDVARRKRIPLRAGARTPSRGSVERAPAARERSCDDRVGTEKSLGNPLRRCMDLVGQETAENAISCLLQSGRKTVRARRVCPILCDICASSALNLVLPSAEVQEKRAHAAWREMSSAAPIAAQLMSRRRRIST